MSIECDICKKSTGSNYSELVAEIREEEKKDKTDSKNDDIIISNNIKLAHIECCTIDQIMQILLSQAKDQISFYQDVIDIVKEGKEELKEKETKKAVLGYNLLKRLNDFEKKNGSFEEIRQDTGIDHNLLICALIAELKKKSQSL